MENTQIIYYDIEPDIKIIQQVVGGYFTIIPVINDQANCDKFPLMYVNEEGLLQNLHVNIKATEMIGYTIYGNVIIVGSNATNKDIHN